MRITHGSSHRGHIIIDPCNRRCWRPREKTTGPRWVCSGLGTRAWHDTAQLRKCTFTASCPKACCQIAGLHRSDRRLLGLQVLFLRDTIPGDPLTGWLLGVGVDRLSSFLKPTVSDSATSLNRRFPQWVSHQPSLA